jgi:hypothetical protein
MTECDYKRTEIEIREMTQAVRNGRVSIYQIAVRCVKLLNDSENYARAIGIRARDVIAHLNGFLQDFAVDVETLLELLTDYPNADQWIRPLAKLLEEARAKRAASKKEQTSKSAQINVRRSATIAEVATLKKQVAEKDAVIAAIAKQPAVAVADSAPIAPPKPGVNELELLRTENKALRIENKKLRRALAEARAELRRRPELSPA